MTNRTYQGNLFNLQKVKHQSQICLDSKIQKIPKVELINLAPELLELYSITHTHPYFLTFPTQYPVKSKQINEKPRIFCDRKQIRTEKWFAVVCRARCQPLTRAFTIVNMHGACASFILQLQVRRVTWVTCLPVGTPTRVISWYAV